MHEIDRGWKITESIFKAYKNIRYFFIKDRVDNGEVKLKYVYTEDLIADILTKPLQGERFRSLRAKLMRYSLELQ